MANVEKSIQVDVPVRTAYNQWTQFEEFPQFMEGVQSVSQIDDTHLGWKAKIGPKDEEWTTTITEQVPDQVVAWQSTTGAENAGRITFQADSTSTTTVTVRIDYSPGGILERIGSGLGFMDRRVQGDLERFKEFIEKRGTETGEWRGEIQGSQVESHG